MTTAPLPPVVESSDDDLGILRYLFDLALQPLGEWQGYDHIEQLGGSALRYQLNSLSYALALSQLTRTPAFTGYLAEAQRNVILKMCDRKVWRYWAYENLVGYGRWNPDPIALNNVMYSAYFGVMVGLYETLNDDRRFSEPGALTLRWKEGQEYAYDFGRLAEAIEFNMRVRPDSPQYPCEPHLIYPMCNTFAFNSLIMHDRLHGTSRTGDLVQRVREVYDRDGWLRADGRFVAGRVEGTKIPILPCSIAYDAVMAFWLNAAMPELARDTWHMVMNNHLHFDHKHPQLKGQLWDRIDFGNYNLARGDTFTRAMLTHTAREMGDEATALAFQNSLEDLKEVTWKGGARRFHGISVMGNGIYAMARFGRKEGMSDLVHGRIPEAWRRGPVLAEAAYPAVLVAKAVSDGEGLELVLRAGEGPQRTTLKLARLQPGGRYRVEGGAADQLVAGEDGTALLAVDLRDRSEVRVWPERVAAL